MAIKQRREIANYLSKTEEKESTGENIVFMGTGFVDLNDSPSAQTGSKRYVNEKSATKSIKGYDWSAPFTCDQVKEEEAIEAIVAIGEDEMTGAEAERDYYKVDLSKPVGQENTKEYEARKRRVAVEVSEFGNDDGELQCSGNLLGIGDWVKGKFNIETRTFTEEATVPDTPTE